MQLVFIVTSCIAALSTLLVISGSNVVHALLALVLSLLSVALLFFQLGAPFAAALEVIVYAGAIMVTFVFVIMLLNLGRHAAVEEKQHFKRREWWSAAVLTLVLFLELVYVLQSGASGAEAVSPTQTGLALFGPYLAAVELGGCLLAAGLIGACHLAGREA